MYAVNEASHAPALIGASAMGVVATREAAEAFLAERGWSVVSFDLDDDNDAADIAAKRGPVLVVFTVTKVEA